MLVEDMGPRPVLVLVLFHFLFRRSCCLRRLADRVAPQLLNLDETFLLLCSIVMELILPF
jgi:hypothetical protein